MDFIVSSLLITPYLIRHNYVYVALAFLGFWYLLVAIAHHLTVPSSSPDAATTTVLDSNAPGLAVFLALVVAWLPSIAAVYAIYRLRHAPLSRRRDAGVAV